MKHYDRLELDVVLPLLRLLQLLCSKSNADERFLFVGEKERDEGRGGRKMRGAGIATRAIQTF